jgi:hypothetical protein
VHDELVQLTECTRIEQAIDPLARGQFPAGVLTLDGVDSPSLLGEGVQAFEAVQHLTTFGVHTHLPQGAPT